MNREILFRGKRRDNGEWIVGNYEWYHKPEKHLISNPYTGETYGVTPETVGQFTGITDKNGIKIFEGDIVKSKHNARGVVEWQKAECSFLVNVGDDWDTMDDCEWEVIGNIYDEPNP